LEKEETITLQTYKHTNSNMAEVPAFDLSMKKKKKKKVSKAVEEAAEGVENLKVSDKEEKEDKEEAEGKEPEAQDDEEEAQREEEEAEDAAREAEAEEAFSFGEKKKPKKKKVAFGEASQTVPTTEGGQQPWAGTDRDYTYEELANRIYSLLHSNNPDLGAKQKRYMMKPPQVCREGTKKTVWLNFAEICSILHRKIDHVLNYVLAELGTNGSIDGNQRLVIKGRFQPKQIENVIRHYITEYVACRTCKSPDTNLKKENRLYFLCCEACGSTRSVIAIKKGFEAQIGKRKKDRKE